MSFTVDQSHPKGLSKMLLPSPSTSIQSGGWSGLGISITSEPPRSFQRCTVFLRTETWPRAAPAGTGAEARGRPSAGQPLCKARGLWGEPGHPVLGRALGCRLRSCTHLGCGKPHGESRCSSAPGPGSGSGRNSWSWVGVWPLRTLRASQREEARQ